MEFLTVKDKFKDVFSGEPRLYRAPGRINLIGEHTDYNEGYVLPAAIDKNIFFAVSENNSDLCRFYALDLDQHYKSKIEFLEYSQAGWPNYLMGVVDQLKKRNHSIRGFDCVFGGDIPIGAGLSSSAAIESGLVYALNDIFQLSEKKDELVKLAQKAENEFVGVNCGIMDQFASLFGKKDHVFRLDCRSLEYEYFPMKIPEYIILLIDTKVKHSLASSEYNTRREECESGVRIIAKDHPEIHSLRDVTNDLLNEYKGILKPSVFKRCRYVTTEIGRVLHACDDLNHSNLDSFGEKMYETHRGLSEEYEVSCEELDFLVKCVMDHRGVIGARMMGGGFGGCTINLVKRNVAEELRETINESYRIHFGHAPLFYEVAITNGVSEIVL